MIRAKVEGLENVEKYLMDKKKAVEDAAVGRIVREAAKPIISSARARVPVGTGLLRKQIGFITSNDNKYKTTALIGVNYNFKGSKRGNSAFYAHIVEYGGKNIKRQPTPFMRPAFMINKDRVSKQIKQRILKLLDIKTKK